MDTSSLWLSAPSDAYRLWQETEAVGADRRPFSVRSRVQHAAMFERFLRHIDERRVSLATFDAAHVESFFNDIQIGCLPGTSTRLRYAKLLHRLCRHLVEIEVRISNPAFEMNAFERWPEDEPLPLFLEPEADARLQTWAMPSRSDDPRMLRNRAIVALFTGTGMSAAELRQTQQQHVLTDDMRPNAYVPKRGARESRRIALPAFALPALTRWKEAQSIDNEALLFPAPGRKTPMNDVLLGPIVRDALEAIGFVAPDMGPRILRNTFARRQLIAGRTNEDTSRLLGLVSQRTVIRLRATIPQLDMP
ncbi:tyrosine-type recombinase/integrase [Paraburkholderia xenovorans]|uniref:tyrosine-type recombinase/integrase n=1 Tax=Paraburkholderia xenovorans TaxID=36873 RepID=UPI0038BC3403